MKVKVVKLRKADELAEMEAAWKDKYGSLNSLQQKVQISKCTSPEMMGDFILWKNISQGAEFQDLIVMRDSEIFDALSPKRAEILEYLSNNHVSSIRNLANALRRNYKNVYDDLTALSKYGLVDLLPRGRSLCPSAAATRIEISFDN